MNKNDGHVTIYGELKQLTDKTDKDSLLAELKEMAQNLDILERKGFENALLKLAQETEEENTRQILFEIMVALKSIWDKYIPKQNLIYEFRTAFKQGEYEEAAQIYTKLKGQGLDYIGTVNREGRLFPIDVPDNYKVLQLVNNELHFLNLELERIENDPIDIPGDRKIIDILPPIKSAGEEEKNDIETKMWILLENSKGERSIVSIDMTDNKINKDSIDVDSDFADAKKLSRFKKNLLLVSESKVHFYRGKKGWKKWFGEEGNKIICTEATKDNFWIGLSDGNVRILKDPNRPGNREKLKKHAGKIKSISTFNQYVVVTSEKLISVTDIGTTPILEPMKAGSKIIQAINLNDKSVVIMQSNGMLVGRDIKQWHINWQINLNEPYESLFICKDKIYCCKKDGNVDILTIANIEVMYKSLESRGIKLLEKPIERKPEAPVRYISDFFGREEILEQIKNQENNHFLIYSGPKTGKTSLLNVLSEALTDKAVCCYIDMEQLLVEKSYEKFEKNFIVQCLSQLALTLKDLNFETDYQRLSSTLSYDLHFSFFMRFYGRKALSVSLF